MARLCAGCYALLGENGKLLFAARKVRRATNTDFVISLVSDDFSRVSNTYIGKLRSNFLGTKFTVYDSQPPVTQQSNRIVDQIEESMPSKTPSNAMHNAFDSHLCNSGRGTAPTPTSFPHSLEDQFSVPSTSKPKEPLIPFSSTSLSETPTLPGAGDPLVLKNKAPRWHEQLQCWCLNLRGRVTVASVNNFQLVAAVKASHQVSAAEQEKVILQFGKIGKDIFTMDYRYPLSAFQAFAICLSSFDTKPDCE
ncbi:hypothetical protein C5167_000865 [Papaver somniferum]|uniref:Tubby C-terminal domain-containing protein n=1 Tax=Papaver somniferum TaxID=3469 RepID=A0A4Y7KVZ5_PAPSO|nr:hypothetical protein C5167_000865 [Papaver somniferum]